MKNDDVGSEYNEGYDKGKLAILKEVYNEIFEEENYSFYPDELDPEKVGELLKAKIKELEK